jgi:pimeloyl-ACP methyl ester carboxylesterase
VNSPNVPLTPSIVFFIHGLNTFGDDCIHMGPLNLGPMGGWWAPRLEEIGCEFHSLREMGFGTIDDQVDRAMKQIERILAMNSESNGSLPVHLFGHSMGGLVARGVAARMVQEFPGRVRTVLTIGSPHGGARAADGAFTFHERSPKLYRLMKLFGYDTRERLEHLKPLRLDAISDFNSRHPELPGIDNVSIVGSVTWHQIGLHYKAFYSQLHPEREESDGLIMSESQRWARDGGRVALDHLGQLGCFALLSLPTRRSARREFERLVSMVQDIIRSNSQPR